MLYRCRALPRSMAGCPRYAATPLNKPDALVWHGLPAGDPIIGAVSFCGNSPFASEEIQRTRGRDAQAAPAQWTTTSPVAHIRRTTHQRFYRPYDRNGSSGVRLTWDDVDCPFGALRACYAEADGKWNRLAGRDPLPADSALHPNSDALVIQIGCHFAARYSVPRSTYSRV